MTDLRISTSRLAILAALPLLFSASALAQDVSVVAGQDVIVDGAGVPRIEIVGDEELTVESGGSIEGQGENAVYLAGTGAVIDNSGKIFTEDGEESALYVDASGAGVDLTITNDSGGEISSVGESTLLGKGTGSGTVTVNNSGLIFADVEDGEDYGGKAIDFHDFKGTNSSNLLYVVVNNYAGGRIEARGSDTIRLGKDNTAATVNNWGEIISSGTGGGSNDGIDLQDKQRDVVINNYATGLIQANQHGIHGKISTTIVNDGRIVGELGSGINIDLLSKTVSVTNRGTVTGGAIAGGDGDGIDIDGKLLLENYGRVEGLNGFTAEGLAIGGGTINNYAGGEIYGEGRGILADDSDEGAAPYTTTIYNEGLIEAGVFDGIKLIGENADSIVNKGTIRGGSSGLAIDMGGGDDTLTLYAGYEIDGIADGGTGVDEINLAGSAPGVLGGNFYRFEQVNVNEGVWSTQLGGVIHEVRDGATLIYDGQLNLAPMVRVQAGGRFEGVGDMEVVWIEGGTLAIAGRDGIGQLDVTNEFSFIDAFSFDDDWNMTGITGATLEITVAADGRSDLLNIVDPLNHRTLDLSHDVYETFEYGPQLEVVALAGNYAEQTEYHIIHVDGEVTGNGFRPEDVTTNFVFLEASLRYDPSDVYLTLTRNDLSFFEVSETPNQQAVAGALMAEGGSELYGYVTGMTGDEEDVREAFDALSGDTHASVAGSVVSAQLGTPAAVLDQVDAAFQALGLKSGGPLGYAATGDDVGSDTGLRVWGQGVVSHASVDGDGNAPGLEQGTGGLLIGADRALTEDIVAGIFGGYSRTSMDVADRDASGDADNFTFGGYLGGRFDMLGVKLGGTYTRHGITTERNVVVGGLDETLTADYGAGTAQLFGELSYELALTSALSVKPFLGLGWLNYSADAFTEEGGLSALSASATSYSTGLVTFGLSGSSQFVLAEGMLASLDGAVGWQHATNGDAPTSELAFASGNPFTVEGAPVVADALVLKAGISVDVNDRFAVGAAYGGQIADGQNAHSLRGSVTGKF
jgi:subtilase-type serine protease